VTTLASSSPLVDTASRPGRRLTRSVVLRGLGLVYLAAFTSLAVQLDGLIGSRGISPAAEYLARAQQVLGSAPATYWRLPTLFWISASDRSLHAVCWSGIAISVALLAGFLPGWSAIWLWVSYLSLVVVGQEFLSFQWDTLLLESGLLAVLVAPWGLWLGRAKDEPWGLSIWLVRWLVFRLMFLSGIVKLTSHDPTWRDWSALGYHYETQPLATPTSWYVHQMPAWFHGLSVGFMFAVELIAPFFVFGPRPIRIVGFMSLVLLQVLIAATGNYGFFNLLAIVLCLSLLDDCDFDWLRRRVRFGKDEAGSIAGASGKAWSWPRKAIVVALGGVIWVVTAVQTLESAVPESIIPSELITLCDWVRPLRSTNNYGLFAVMTTKRPEIIVEGSDDGVNWQPYRFRWKPCELDRAPLFTTPHMPRLDWQMWFAALAGDCRSAPWFIRFVERLLAGERAVVSLLRDNPFPDHPPRYVRARLFLYRFSRWGSGDWWTREDAGMYCPILIRP
jgi:lipase maturation factor 1